MIGTIKSHRSINVEGCVVGSDATLFRSNLLYAGPMTRPVTLSSVMITLPNNN